MEQITVRISTSRVAKAWDWAVLAVTGTGVVWSFRQADWEDWWGTIEGLFRSGDLNLQPTAPGCCVASSVYDDDELEALGPECGSFRLSVLAAVDRLAALGSNVRDATTRVRTTLTSSNFVTSRHCGSLKCR